MKKIWSLTIEDYLEIVKLSNERGIKPGESMEKVLEEYMEGKGQKPIGHTELTQDELLKEYSSKGKKTLSIETKNGQTSFKTIRDKDNV